LTFDSNKLKQLLETTAEQPVANWEDIRDSVMFEALTAKFEANLRLRAKLMGTHDEDIRFQIDDAYWGTSNDGLGMNRLGQLLVEVRANCRARAEDTAAIQCAHQTAADLGRVCCHIMGGEAADVFLYFDDMFAEKCHLVCQRCGQDEPLRHESLRLICSDCVSEYLHSKPKAILGARAPKARNTTVHFDHEDIVLGGIGDINIVAVSPDLSESGPRWFALAHDATLWQFDFSKHMANRMCDVPFSHLDWGKPISLVSSANGRFVAAYNTKGQFGCVLSVEDCQVTTELDRGNDHIEHYDFSVSFFESPSRTLLIHATAWNRLDITDPAVKQLLTERQQPNRESLRPEPDHYLDYFHSRILVSPTADWVADYGWHWHPYGLIYSWNLQVWLQTNVWESEDGASKHYFAGRPYFWDGPWCWIDDVTLAVWGYGDDDCNLVDAVLFFDVTTGQQTHWFAGPHGDFAYDEFLYCYSQDEGTSVWDVATGECLVTDRSLKPLGYHARSRTFLSRMPDGAFRISRLMTQP